MKAILMLIPVALALGGIGLVGFLWALRSGQFEDLDGAANRILFDYDDPPAANAPEGASADTTADTAPDAASVSVAGETADKQPPEPKP